MRIHWSDFGAAMLITVFFLSASPASAQTYITQVAEPVISADEFGCTPDNGCNPVSGGWPRTLWYDDVNGDCPPLPERTSWRDSQHLDTDCTGWKLLYAQGGNYKMVHVPDVSDVSTIADFQYQEIAPSGELRDHAFTRCPSGNYLHTASANLDSPNDSAYAYRYDKDLNPIYSGAIEERAAERAHNDMPLACSPLGHLTAFGNAAPESEAEEDVDINVYTRYFWLGQDGATVRTKDLVDMPRTAGCTFHWDPDTKHLLVVEMDRTHEMVISELDTDLNMRHLRTVTVLPEFHRGGWPQGFLRIGDYYMVAFVNQGTPGEFVGLVGDIWVAVFDRSWNLMEAQATTDFDYGPNAGGAMTPSLSRHGDKVLLSFDWNVHPGLQQITLDLDAFGVTDGDTGGYWDTGGLFDDTGSASDDTSTGSDSGSSENDDTAGKSGRGVEPVWKTCGGCAAAPEDSNAAWGWLAASLLMIRRRRQS